MKHPKPATFPVHQPRLLALDVDGVLTDNCVSIHSDNTESKAFYIPDGAGMRLLLEAGIAVVWISGRPSASTDLRAKELQITQLHTGIRDKAACLLSILEELSLTPEDVVYVGDDLIDLPAFEVAGYTVAPSDAQPEILEKATAVTHAAGGKGAVREVCDWILSTSQKPSNSVDTDSGGLS
ncbi:MAG: HAD hydrolase family protein [Planctomycetia bacterium]|nr:HAD hydrolase family protein [Planctomycetia bacterium]